MHANQQNSGDEIRFAFGKFSLGLVMVAATSKGIAAIMMGDGEDTLCRELASAFPDARLMADGTGLREEIARVSTFLDAPHKGLDLPLDIRGSAQQQAIWQALRNIPAGHTAAYGEIAKSLPLPATAQDVGAACAANVLAVAIPCHRVVKSDGSISGYRWGVQRKRKLINMEAVA